MTKVKIGRVAGWAATLLLAACSAPSLMDADPQTGVSALGEGIAPDRSAGGSSVSFADSFENGPSGWWFSSSDLGNGYVSRRAEARSPSRVGDEYSNRNPLGQSQALSRQFLLPAIPLSGCDATVWIDPLTAVDGVLEIDDAATKNPLRSGSFSLAGTQTWTLVSTDGAPLGSPTSNAIIVRVELTGNGAWQEFLFDDVSGTCGIP